MNCPNCGMPKECKHGEVTDFACGSWAMDSGLEITPACREIATLRKRVEELEAVVTRLRGHLDSEMLVLLDQQALGGAGGEG